MTPSEALVAERAAPGAGVPLDPEAASWGRVREVRLAMVPAPLGLVAAVSPYLARSQGHGHVRELRVRLLRDRETLGLHLAWDDSSRDDRIDDLDRFADGAAVMFPITVGASAVTMGSAESPVNMWYWRADRSEPFDVIAEGFATSRRRPPGPSGLEAQAAYGAGGWRVVFRRRLQAPGREWVDLAPGPTGVAFAIWDGAHAERAGQKSISGEFLPLRLEA